ncbi:precorrin-6y C5,15-methyltransferase (decarboxylating) subunit CbiE [Chitinophaga flava]|uniref:Bifunctional cobalt-precorrin-7 (C(5))-methyltransferase/cobalt-precorrin-6B (C(15))-methyltransferase n=1 Tax=Chitinophaga flava TaxID=2259036 RepID=A0A365Y070_9BACT|nr:precorrin-6y C5,15-methyltransferase (decarboxylating) subunit CbiE [Chitinophaga flava]RBL91324.1 bifunctional cobalt-precorrin-7 (C(5))-methyltransferase/cobalt-precorrin-6B (C(15))-methyltransferase [Chitinophaga flava]
MPEEYIVIGVANTTANVCSPEAMELLSQYQHFSGGERHYALVKHLLPVSHHWITIKGNMPALFAQYEQVAEPLVVFASGDPLFYGMVNTIRKYAVDANVKVYPQFNSIQRLCAKAGIPYEQVCNVSVHGRSWQELDAALIRGQRQIAILTDLARTPQAIAQRMMEYRFTQYDMLVGEDLDGVAEQLSRDTLEVIAGRTFHPLNCVLLQQVAVSQQPGMGIEDSRFEGLPGRPNMITKRTIRLASIAQLQLQQATVCWDIGFCTGAVAIEARRLYPHLQVVAFEKRSECEGIITRNMKQLSAPGIDIHMGDFYEEDHAALPIPDAVFIGGHGNRLDELMQIIDSYMRPGGRVVINAVLDTSREQFVHMTEKLQWQLLPAEQIQVGDHNPITVLTAIKQA